MKTTVEVEGVQQGSRLRSGLDQLYSVAKGTAKYSAVYIHGIGDRSLNLPTQGFISRVGRRGRSLGGAYGEPLEPQKFELCKWDYGNVRYNFSPPSPARQMECHSSLASVLNIFRAKNLPC